MANIVTYKARPDIPCIQMGNGITSVFVSVLALGASELAKTNRQREFAAWFASHDQGVYGPGRRERVAWLLDTFGGDRGFVLQGIRAANARVGWERLGYEPREEWVQHCLDQFRAMVEAFSIAHAAGSEAAVWRYGRPTRLVLCLVHRVYQHEHGCALCNDQ